MFNEVSVLGRISELIVTYIPFHSVITDGLRAFFAACIHDPLNP